MSLFIFRAVCAFGALSLMVTIFPWPLAQTDAIAWLLLATSIDYGWRLGGRLSRLWREMLPSDGGER